MSRRKLTTTTSARGLALVASLTLAVPLPAFAQEGENRETCADGSSPPCGNGGQAAEEQGEGQTRQERRQQRRENRAQEEAQQEQAEQEQAQEEQAEQQQERQQEAEPEIPPQPAPEEAPPAPEPEIRPDPVPENQPAPDETPPPAPEELPQQDEPAQNDQPRAEGRGDGGGESEAEAGRSPDASALEEALRERQDGGDTGEAQAEDAEDADNRDRPRDEQGRAPEQDDNRDDAQRRAAPEAAPDAAAQEQLRDGEAQDGEAQDGEGRDRPDAATLEERLRQRQDGDRQDADQQDANRQDGDAQDDNAGNGDGQGRERLRDALQDRQDNREQDNGETAEGDGTLRERVQDLAEDDDARERLREAAENLPDQPDAQSGEPPVAEALSALAAGDGDAPDGVRVFEEEVTERQARSSSEEFRNSVNERGRGDRDRDRDRDRNENRDRNDNRNSNDNDDDDDDDGFFEEELSDREKVLLFGLGALAVGSMLSNDRQVELNSGDRVVVQRPDGSYQLIKDDDVLLRRPGSDVRTETFRDGSTRTIVTREDGARIVTVYDPEQRVVRRSVIRPDGTEYLLIDDTRRYEPVDVSQLPRPRYERLSLTEDERALRDALSRSADINRTFSLAQIRNIAEVRSLVPVIDVNAITFQTGSAAIRPEQAEALASLGQLIQDYVDENPSEIFLIEGHTDAVGSAASNLALSDRRAESVALALTEYFDVPPENMIVQGYGESYLAVDTSGAEERNRRVSVRRVTDLLETASN